MGRFAPLCAVLLWTACAIMPGRGGLPPAPPRVHPPEFALEPAFLPGDESVLADDLGALFERDAAASSAIAFPGLPLGVNPADFDITIHYNADVQYWLDFFTGRGRERFELFLTRQGRYEDMIRGRLRERGMPEDLIYLALIESGFSPRAVSTAQAVGIWQFIAATGRRYGLEVSPFVDERRDPVRATEAALDYLGDLYNQFGSWYLAAAAYNTGENRVERVLRERVGGARGNDAIFWEIQRYLPSETRAYVPMMLAAGILSKYAEDQGFYVEPELPETFDVVRVPDATDLDVIAEAAGVSRAEINALNPHFLRGMTPPRRAVDVRVPEGRGEAFAAAYALIPPEQRVRFIEHTVGRGETLSGLASRYGSTVAEIQAANDIRNPNAISVGRVLIIPRAGAASAARAQPPAIAVNRSSPAPGSGGASSSARPATPSSTGAASVYRVRSGDTLWSIANRNGVSVRDLQGWNNLGNRSTIRPGQELIVRPASVAAAVTHSVEPGDTLWSIAQRHGVTAAQLMEWNGLAANAVIRPGDRITVRSSR